MTDTPNSEPGTPNIEHVPVLLSEAVDLLSPKPGGVYVDGTLGAGGHAAEILTRSAPDGVLIGLDQDAEAVERSRAVLAPFGARVVIRQANFRDLPTVLTELGCGPVNGVLLDLGVSWFHLRSPQRGFSFMLEGPLDMRMDRGRPRNAADLVNGLPREELARIIREYGEERKAGAIARAIEQARAREPITTTAQLARIVSSVFPPYSSRRIHPATLTFQALRIAVNDEMAALRDALVHTIPLLQPGGRMAIISFHSLEDRIVKQSFVAAARGCTCPPKLPVCGCGTKPVLNILTKRPITAGREELARNPASRSAKLRAAEKL
ncbi:MAG: 16S rRNA (cytosine(1402)-N(4))-methyltransferase [Nitrospirae bacterium GWD2_57_9]|nr:MAG: 16S rRNA (cytosine(1402)-N(4))-methyltransferase [Nitrospirae bacterium GWD2_57_9]OGW50841.1 MAG: 16S rRNA (cytosine(1402)-N(4))-methyltransferase [Nitrospirae bacterium GWC2_57_9]